MSELKLPWRAPAPRARQGRLVPVLLFILGLQVCCYLGMRTAPWYAASRWLPAPEESSQSRITRWRQARYEASRDLQVGSLLGDHTLPAVVGSPVTVTGATGRTTVLVFLPEFGCSAKSLLSSWSTLHREFPEVRLIGVTAHSDEDLKQACVASLRGVKVAVDEGRRLERELNAAWRPRAYLFDRSGRLQYAQPVSTMDPTAVLEVREYLRAHAG